MATGYGRRGKSEKFFKKTIDKDDDNDILVLVEIGQVKRLRYAD